MNLNLYSKKLSKYKKTVLAKAALLTGLTLSFVGCGTPQAKPKYESKTDSAKMEVVQDTTELVDEELTETSTVDTIEGKVSTTENGKTTEQQTAYVVDPETKTTESIGEITTEKTTEKGGKTTTTVVTTTSKTNDKTTTGKTTTGKTTTGKTTTSKTTTNKTTQPTTTTVVTTTKVTTAKPTTTTTTTTAPVQTEPIVTTIPYASRTYTKYDMLSSDPIEARYAFDDVCGDFDRDLFGNYIHQNQYGSSYGDVSGEILAILNYNQGLNPEMLGDEFGFETRESFLQKCDNLNLADYQYFYETNVDFTKYVIDEDLANFLNRVCSEYKEYANGNEEPLRNEIENYFNSGDIGNYVKYYFMVNTKVTAETYSYGNYFYTCDPDAQQLYYENVAGPLHDSFAEYKYTGYYESAKTR